MLELNPSETYNKEIAIAAACAEDELGNKNVGPSIPKLYREWNLSDNPIGFFNPYMGGCQYNICDLFPFFEKIVLPIPHPPNQKQFESMVGISPDQLLELVRMGKLLPLFSDPGSVPDYLKEVYLEDMPYQHRMMFFNLFITNKKVLSNSEIVRAGKELNSFWHSYIREIFKAIDLNESEKALVSRYLTNLCISHGLPTALALLAFYSSRSYDKSEIISNIRVDVTSLLWSANALGFIQPYDSVDQFFLSQLSKISKDDAIRELCQRIVEDIGGSHLILDYSSPEDAVNCIHAPSELIAYLKKEYCYEPPEVYLEPVKYAYHLMRHDEIRDNYKIFKTLDDELKQGKFRRVLLGSDNDLEIVFNEINRLVRVYQQNYNRVRLAVNFGCICFGAAFGAFAGQAISNNELSLLFAYCGAHAASVLARSKADELSKKLAPIFQKRNSAILVWRKQLEGAR